MKSLAKNRILIIAILLSVILAVSGVLAFVFTRQIPETHAEENYGYLHDEGYYEWDGVVFYAIKVENVRKYKFNENVIKVNDGEIDENIIITKNNTGSFLYGDQEITSITLDDGQEITLQSEFDKYITLLNYYPSYTLADSGLQTIKYGETVLLKEGESILISFARHEYTDNLLEESLVGNSAKGFISASVDFLNVDLWFNEAEAPVSNAPIKDGGNDGSDMFGYIFTTRSNLNDESNVQKEGLVQFSANYEKGGMETNYGFSFYVFNQETYQREEKKNENKNRPAPEIDVATAGGNYVTDSRTANRYYGEYFYYYQNQNLATLTYKPERYKVDISKTIHSTVTSYSFSYDREKNEVVYNINANKSTEGVYARDIAYEYNKETGEVTLRFKDIGVYEISYTASSFNFNDLLNIPSAQIVNKIDSISLNGNLISAPIYG